MSFLYSLCEHHEGFIIMHYLVSPSVNNLFWLIHWLLDMKDWACEDWPGHQVLSLSFIGPLY